MIIQFASRMNSYCNLRKSLLFSDFKTVIKMSLFFLLFLLSNNTIGQTYLSGEVVVTNPQKASVALNYEFEAGTIGSFTYDGEGLSLNVKKRVFDHVTTSIGLGFRPTGEQCFYVSLEDGVDMGYIDVEGTGSFYGNSLKVSFNPSYKVDFCVNWISNTTFSVSPENAATQRMIIRPKVTVSFIPKLLLKTKEELEPSIVLKDKEEETIEAYCLDTDKSIPNQGDRFSYGNDSILDMSLFDEGSMYSPLIIQSLVYNYLNGYSIDEDDIIYILKGESSYLLFLRQHCVIKYSDEGFESSVPLPLGHIKNTLDLDRLLQGKKDNRLYFNDNLPSDYIQMMKQILLSSGFQDSDDGSLICPDCNVDQFYVYYSEALMPYLLESYSTIIESMIEE